MFLLFCWFFVYVLLVDGGGGGLWCIFLEVLVFWEMLFVFVVLLFFVGGFQWPWLYRPMLVNVFWYCCSGY